MLLSIVVPMVAPSDLLTRLFGSLAGLRHPSVEFILINQSGAALDQAYRHGFQVQFVEKVVGRMSAADARNYGASVAQGEFLFFLDDDAFIHSSTDTLNDLLEHLKRPDAPDVFIANCGTEVAGAYVSHWKQSWETINYKNIYGAVIEWNLIIRKQKFFFIGAFPRIGTGSPHSAQAGEAFVLMSKALYAGLAITMLKKLKVAHPSLTQVGKSLKVILGYYYGDGYGAGISFCYFTRSQKIFWAIRVVLGAFYYLVKQRKKMHKPPDGGSMFAFRKTACTARLTGFCDGLKGRDPREQTFLAELSAR